MLSKVPLGVTTVKGVLLKYNSFSILSASDMDLTRPRQVKGVSLRRRVSGSSIPR